MNLRALVLDIPILRSSSLAPPDAAPVALTATPVSATQTNLAWVNKATNTPDGNNIYRRVQGAGSWTFVASVAANATSYNDTGVTSGANTDHKVTAVKNGIELSSNIVGSNTLTRSPALVLLFNSNGNGVTRYDNLGVTSPLADHGTVAQGTFSQYPNSVVFHTGNSQYLSAANTANVTTGDIQVSWCIPVILISKTAGSIMLSKYNTGTNQHEYRILYAGGADRFQLEVTVGTTATVVNCDALGSPVAGNPYVVIAWHDSVANLIGVTVIDMLTQIAYTNASAYSNGINATASGILIGAQVFSAPTIVGDFTLGPIFMAKTIWTDAEKAALGTGLVYPFAVQYEPSFDQDAFAVQSGNRLAVNGQEWKPVGINAYWLSVFTTTYTTGLSAWQVEDGIRMAKNMGANTIRIWCGGFGNAVSLYPTLGGAFNEANFVQLDQALNLIRRYGMRAILTLADGQATTAFGDVASGFWGDVDFYNNATAINNFLTLYCDPILNRVNTKNGLTYKNDPTILLVEPMNEPGTPGAWTQTVAAHIKATAPNLLILDGKHNGVAAASLTDVNIAAVCRHLYPQDVSTLDTTLATANLVAKVFGVFEFEWNGNRTPPEAAVGLFYNDLEGKQLVAGDLAWMMTPHDEGGGWITAFGGIGANGFAMMLGDPTAAPSGQSGTMNTLIKLLRAHILRRRGITALVWMTPDQPLVLTHNAGTNTLTYRGAAGAETYTLQTSSDDITFNDTVTGLTDISGGTVTNAALIAGIHARMVGVNPDGVKGTPSVSVQM